jgi:hypothetical protein
MVGKEDTAREEQSFDVSVEEGEQSMLVMWPVASLDWRLVHSGSRDWLFSSSGWRFY